MRVFKISDRRRQKVTKKLLGAKACNGETSNLQEGLESENSNINKEIVEECSERYNLSELSEDGIPSDVEHNMEENEEFEAVEEVYEEIEMEVSDES